jgi:hypothetical protein
MTQWSTMPPSTSDIFFLSVRALGTTQAGLGAMLGVSRRTAQRWSQQGVPSYSLPQLARLVYPHDAMLAARVAAALGTTLEAMGVAPPPPPARPAPDAAAFALPPSPPPPPEGVVDAVVCAASDAMNALPRDVRAGLLAAFTRAREIGVDIPMVERVLRAQLAPLPPQGGAPDAAPPGDRRKGARA